MIKVFALVTANSRIDTNYFLYEMQDSERDALIEQINENFKDRWNQTRHIINLWCDPPMTLPWDSSSDTDSTYTTADIQLAAQKFFDHQSKFNK